MARTGPGRIYQQGRIWWIDYSFRGKRHRESAGSTRRGDAVKLLRRRMAEMGKGKLIGRSEERVTFEDLAKDIETDYKNNERSSTRRLRTSLGHLGAFFGGSRALNITTDRIRRYIESRQDEGAANASIQRELSTLGRAFTLARQAERLTSPPVYPQR